MMWRRLSQPPGPWHKRLYNLFKICVSSVAIRGQINLINASLRAAAIPEWRGLPERKMRPDRWQSPADLVPKLMQRLGLRERLHETEVIDAWSKIVGEFIAAHSAPVALREGVLYVRVLQPALHYELEQVSKSDILRKLKKRFGGKTIRDIRFRVG